MKTNYVVDEEEGVMLDVRGHLNERSSGQYLSVEKMQSMLRFYNSEVRDVVRRQSCSS